MDVEGELQSLTGVKPNRRESDQGYMERIVKALDDVPDKKYNKLSKAAQDWAEEATQAYNSKEDYPAFPEAEEDEPADEPDQEEAAADEPDEEAGGPETDEPEDDEMPTTHTDEDETPRRGSRRAAPPPPKKAAGKTTNKATTKGKDTAAAAKAGGCLTYARMLMVKHPDISTADLAEKVKAKGFAVSIQTLHTTRSGFRQDIRALQEAGLLKRKLV